MKLIPTEERRSQECFLCGSRKSVKYYATTHSNGQVKQQAVCSSCALRIKAHDITEETPYPEGMLLDIAMLKYSEFSALFHHEAVQTYAADEGRARDAAELLPQTLRYILRHCLELYNVDYTDDDSLRDLIDKVIAMEGKAMHSDILLGLWWNLNLIAKMEVENVSYHVGTIYLCGQLVRDALNDVIERTEHICGVNKYSASRKHML